MSYTKKLIDFCIEMDKNVLPNEVIDKTKYLLLDYLGVAIRGADSNSGQNILKYIQAMDLDPISKIIGTSTRTIPQYAALANGVSSHSLEMDDVVNTASLHPGTVVFSTVLALAPKIKASGKDLLNAAIIGYEVMIRVGNALNPEFHYQRGFHPTGTAGVFGATAAASKLLNLNKKEFMAAIGLAGSMASGSMQYLTNGAWNKRFHAGWSSHNGIIAAQVANNGFIGSVDALDGKFGFLHGYSDAPKLDDLVSNLGSNFQIMSTSIKPHACCRYNQAPIDCTTLIVAENYLNPDDIEEISVGLLKTAIPIVAEPLEYKSNPQSVVDAQFSLPYAIALAIYRGKATLDEFNESLINDVKMKDLMSKVSYFTDEKLDELYPNKWPASVSIKDRRGNIYYKYLEHPIGDPENPLSWKDLQEKFKILLNKNYKGQILTELIENARNIDQYEDINSFLDFCP